MARLRYHGDEDHGLIVGDGRAYPYTIEDGQVRVRLPFAVDQSRLRDLLTGDGWAVGLDNEGLDSQGWGPGYDVDGYYPCWVWADAHGTTTFAFPPQDYLPAGSAPVSGGDGGRRPVWGPRSLDEFARWFDYLRAASAGEGWNRS